MRAPADEADDRASIAAECMPAPSVPNSGPSRLKDASTHPAQHACSLQQLLLVAQEEAAIQARLSIKLLEQLLQRQLRELSGQQLNRLVFGRQAGRRRVQLVGWQLQRRPQRRQVARVERRDAAFRVDAARQQVSTSAATGDERQRRQRRQRRRARRQRQHTAESVHAPSFALWR